MDERLVAITASALVLSAAAGFLVGNQMFSEGPEPKYSEFFEVRLNHSQDREEVEFDNQSIHLMYESADKARVYIDKDRDGSADIELENLTRDGKEHETSQVVTLEHTSYRLHFRYSDDGSKREDGYIVLYEIREI